MERRQFVKAGVLLGATGLLPRLSAAGGPGPEDWGSAFAGALAEDRYLLGWATPDFDRIGSGPLNVEGSWPQGLAGTLWRNGSAVHDRHGLRYRHWFDGDGMIQEFRIAGGSAAHRARTIATPKLRREDAAGRRLYPGFGTTVAEGPAVRRPDDMNAANISVVEHHGELLALWEGGSASVLDPDTLAWREFKVWGPGLEGVPFTAHPKLDADGNLWAFGYSTGARPTLVLYQVSPAGALVKTGLVPVDPLGMVHDFVTTARHLVIVVPPFVVEPGAATDFLSSHAWRPQLGSRVLVVNKSDFDDRRWYQLPAAFGFHHGNGWEERDGTIRFDHCLADSPRLVAESMRAVMRGEPEDFAIPRYASLTLYPNGHAHVEVARDSAEFPQVAPGRVGRRNGYLYHLGLAENESRYLRTLVKRDTESGRIETFDFGPGTLPEEHLFVPSGTGDAEDKGWLLGTVLDYERGVSGLTVFDARGIADGPLATAWLPYPLPLGFHGCFRSAFRAV